MWSIIKQQRGNVNITPGSAIKLRVVVAAIIYKIGNLKSNHVFNAFIAMYHEHPSRPLILWESHLIKMKYDKNIVF